MDFFTITAEELNALDGLPYIQQVLYFRGIRPYMDRKTGIVGIRRRISYQSLREALYVEPIAGTQTVGSPSYDQVRRAVKQLIQKGLLEVQPARMQLIFKCVLALRDKSVQNKAATWPPEEAASKAPEENPAITRLFNSPGSQAARPNGPQADIPHKDNNFLFFLSKNFETFWESYPQKLGKHKAWEVFQTISPDQTLMQTIMTALAAQITSQQEKQALGHWVPHWKNPANWLTQQCWEDEIVPITAMEKSNAKYQTRSTKKSPADIIWESCKGGIDFDFDAEPEAATKDNVIALRCYREEV